MRQSQEPLRFDELPMMSLTKIPYIVSIVYGILTTLVYIYSTSVPLLLDGDPLLGVILIIAGMLFFATPEFFSLINNISTSEIRNSLQEYSLRKAKMKKFMLNVMLPMFIIRTFLLTCIVYAYYVTLGKVPAIYNIEIQSYIYCSYLYLSLFYCVVGCICLNCVYIMIVLTYMATIKVVLDTLCQDYRYMKKDKCMGFMNYLYNGLLFTTQYVKISIYGYLIYYYYNNNLYDLIYIVLILTQIIIALLYNSNANRLYGNVKEGRQSLLRDPVHQIIIGGIMLISLIVSCVYVVRVNYLIYYIYSGWDIVMVILYEITRLISKYVCGKDKFTKLVYKVCFRDRHEIYQESV